MTVLQNAFNSLLTGVQTYEASSEPGWSETAMYIRGVRTLNSAARSPLVIVDNVERDISFLDAFPIDNVTVLKDAAATALYGMRGANGVILVTTKRGDAGKTNIEFTQEIGFQTLTERLRTRTPTTSPSPATRCVTSTDASPSTPPSRLRSIVA